MNDSIDKYIYMSKKNLNTILLNLETNIEFTENDLWSNSDEFKKIVENVIEIYFNKYYLYKDKTLEKINKYIKLNKNIDRKLKTILLAIIDYYENLKENETITRCENSILYLTVLIYTGLTIYNKNYESIDTPPKIEKIINNIIDNFAKIRFSKNKDLDNLINNIKNSVKENNNFEKLINILNNKYSHNYYSKVNKNTNYYKTYYEFEIDNLNEYEDKDISIVTKRMKIDSVFTGISYDLAYFTSFKLLRTGHNITILFPIKKEDLMDKNIRDYLTKRNKVVNDQIKFLIDYNDLENNYEFLNKMKDENIDIFIEVNQNMETNNYNMFMNIKNVIVPEEFLSTNEKYMEIWKDMNMNFIIKDYSEQINEQNLLKERESVVYE